MNFHACHSEKFSSACKLASSGFHIASSSPRGLFILLKIFSRACGAALESKMILEEREDEPRRCKLSVSTSSASSIALSARVYREEVDSDERRWSSAFEKKTMKKLIRII